eukprot:COSAG01_NODE_866_length_13045_cov_12.921288_1_plen_90_part_00
MTHLPSAIVSASGSLGFCRRSDSPEPAGAAEALIAKITVVRARTLGMHPRLLLIDSRLKVPSQRTTVILADAAVRSAASDRSIGSMQCV